MSTDREQDGLTEGVPARQGVSDSGQRERWTWWTSPQRLSRKQMVAVWILAGAIFLPNAGSFGLWDPWETHYGEVTRNMVETSDWLSPFWGFRSKVGTEPVAGKPFFSKPIFLFWSEAFTSRLIGLSDWSIRLPIALLAMSVLALLAHALSRIYSPFIGGLSALIVGTSPQFFFIGRQAQTDMPFVAMMSLGILFFMLGAFGPARARSAVRTGWAVGISLALILLSTIPQYGVLATDLFPTGETTSFVQRMWQTGTYHVAVYAVLLILFGATLYRSIRKDRRAMSPDAWGDKWTRRSYFWLFYVCCAHATLAKGLLGFLLPGAILFFYFLITKRWRDIGKMDLPRGLMLFVAVGFPWYFGMFAKHGMAYYKRFFIHDHFNRMNAGVHQIDSGTFEHFLKWLSYGMWPWIALAPLAFLLFFRRLQSEDARIRPENWFVFLWFFISFTVFTSSSTKFHHYIFPALIPLGILVARAIQELPSLDANIRRAVAVVSVLLAGIVGWDIRTNPQSLRNLFTYKYDRPMPDSLPVDVNAPVADGAATVWGDSLFYEMTNAPILHALNVSWTQFEPWIGGTLFLACIGLLLMGLKRGMYTGLGTLAASALGLAVWGLNVYMPSFTPHWSQKYLFEKLYADCTLMNQSEEIEEAYSSHLPGGDGLAEWFGATGKRVCEEDIISWLITWRGETYYSNNEIIPIQKEATQFEAYLKDFNKGKAFYVMMERGKEESWTRKLNKTYLPKVAEEEGFQTIQSFTHQKIFDENRYFILVKISPVAKKG